MKSGPRQLPLGPGLAAALEPGPEQRWATQEVRGTKQASAGLPFSAPLSIKVLSNISPDTQQVEKSEPPATLLLGE